MVIVGDSAVINYGQGTVLTLNLKTKEQATIQLGPLKLLGVFVSPEMQILGSNGKCDIFIYKDSVTKVQGSS